MKAITIHQPNASAIALGFQRFMVRDWAYYGANEFLAIHAGKSFRPVGARLFEQHRDLFHSAGISTDTLPFSAVVAIVDVAEVVPTDLLVRDGVITTAGERMGVTPLELALGNWASGRKAWRLKNLMRLPEPIPARGQRRLWTWVAPTGTSKTVIHVAPAADMRRAS